MARPDSQTGFRRRGAAPLSARVGLNRGELVLPIYMDRHHARGTVFRLIDAPDPGAASRAHRESHGHVASDIIEVDLSAVEAFLGRMQDPKPPPSRDNARSGEPLRVRMGLRAGEPVEDTNDLFGATVQIASRLCDAAHAGQILASDRVRQECPDRSRFLDVGSRHLKGFAQPVPAFAIEWR